MRYYRDSDLAVASRLDSVEKLSIGESKTFASLRGINELRKLHFLGLYGNNNLLNLASISEAPVRWSRFTGQFGGKAKMDFGFDYAASLSSIACLA